MGTITPNLWFDNNAEEAAQFYVDTFNAVGRGNSSIGVTERYDKKGAEVSGQKEGAVMLVEFVLDGNPFVGINGGPIFKFSEAVSFMIQCEDQAEIDFFWSAFTADGGMEQPCGWVKDKFGLSWQIVPKAMTEMRSTGTPEQIQRMMAAMFEMKKLDIAKLESAFRGE